ncbi:MAG: patatin-like phospholipase family protein [Gluconacetobacter diazotrophicus]|nr:patatin-like phospholipase family protein [Gluconacetobacter diazotrophicus]
MLSSPPFPQPSNPKVHAYSTKEIRSEEEEWFDPDDGPARAALCLSGGGIRSAAFGLGALMALSEAVVPDSHDGSRPAQSDCLLDRFHYLSTVSGGGYIGAWLIRWITEKGCSGLRNLGASEELRSLREHANFLTPQPGPLSPDSWTGVILWLRNTLINWMILAPSLIATAALILLYGLLVRAAASAPASAPVAALTVAVTVIALAGLGLGIRRTICDLPTHLYPDPGRTAGDAASGSGRTVGVTEATLYKTVVRPTLLWAFLIPVAVALMLSQSTHKVPDSPHLLPLLRGSVGISPRWPFGPCYALPLSSFAVDLLAFGAAVVSVRRSYDRRPNERSLEWKRFRDLQMAAFGENLLPWIVASLCSAAILYLGIQVVHGVDVVWLVALGPAWVITSEMLRSTAYVAWRRAGLRSALDREWLARLNVAKLRPVMAFLFLATAILWLPPFVFAAGHPAWRFATAVVGFLSGPAAALLGRSARTLLRRDNNAVRGNTATDRAWVRADQAVAALSLLFLSLLLIAFGEAAGALVASLAAWIENHDGTAPDVTMLLAADVVLLLLSAFIAWANGRSIRINRFSLHAVYANRLVRAFLGSARVQTERRPDPFTGFDPADDIRVAEVLSSCLRGDPHGQPAPSGKSPSSGIGRGGRSRRLFPVINATLNVTRGTGKVPVGRKAMPFTITPFHCGSGSLEPSTTDPEKSVGQALSEPPGVYVPTRDYAGGYARDSGPGDERQGMSLGTAMAISGAAVSPNMGYHSSTLTAFVMTLFNARLGVWLPNPAMPGASLDLMHRASPANALESMCRELFGLSDADGSYVYLSDGGHFDNLGLYEMLRRHCRWIMVIDAGEDREYGYASLGQTLRRAFVDLGARVEFRPPVVAGEKLLPQQGSFADITYRAEPGRPERGSLLYIKSWLPPDAAIELHAYRNQHADFPNSSLLNQFFDENDFESYRALGARIVEGVLKATTASGSPGSMEELFQLATPPPNQPARIPA